MELDVHTVYVTDEDKFPEDETDPDNISIPNNIHLLTSDLPRPYTDPPRALQLACLSAQLRLDTDARLKEAANTNPDLTVKTP